MSSDEKILQGKVDLRRVITVHILSVRTTYIICIKNDPDNKVILFCPYCKIVDQLTDEKTSFNNREKSPRANVAQFQTRWMIGQPYYPTPLKYHAFI